MANAKVKAEWQMYSIKIELSQLPVQYIIRKQRSLDE
jgi:hypothetical protein